MEHTIIAVTLITVSLVLLIAILSIIARRKAAKKTEELKASLQNLKDLNKSLSAVSLKLINLTEKVAEITDNKESDP